jgi:hypothetical protein
MIMASSSIVAKKAKSEGTPSRYTVQRSRGFLLDIDIEYFGTDDLLQFIAQK